MFLCFSLFMIKPTVALSPVQAYFTFQRASIQPILIGLKAVPVQMMQTVICRTDWLTYCEDLTKQQCPGLTNAHMLVPKNFSSSMATWGHCKNESEPTDSHIKMAKIKKHVCSLVQKVWPPRIVFITLWKYPVSKEVKSPLCIVVRHLKVKGVASLTERCVLSQAGVALHPTSFFVSGCKSSNDGTNSIIYIVCWR